MKITNKINLQTMNTNYLYDKVTTDNFTQQFIFK